MAPKGHHDRCIGKLLWHVWLMYGGKRSGSFPTKTKVREFYTKAKAKAEQHEGRFFPERYQHVGYELVQDAIDRYLGSMEKTKSYRDHVCFAKWWGSSSNGSG